MRVCACGEGKRDADGENNTSVLLLLQAVSRDFICEECQNSTLNKLESMLEILQTDTKQGTVTPTEIGDNILNIMGEQLSPASPPPPLSPPPSSTSITLSVSFSFHFIPHKMDLKDWGHCKCTSIVLCNYD